MTDDRGQTMAIRGNKGACPLGATEDGGQRTEDRVQKTEDRSQMKQFFESTYIINLKGSHGLHQDSFRLQTMTALIKSFCGGVQGGQFFQKAPPLAAGGKGVKNGC